ncbi:hypothetical protein PQX77_012934 [Marasmius sp. AFHP31]|nr:hypothetical protein PQX77_012934 [Marasmius sp. AFHP31]
MIEAMAVLRPIVGDERMEERLQQTISSALDQASINLFGVSGVLPNILITRGNANFGEQEDGDMYLLRALAEAHRRGLPTALRESIDAVLGVHYNALRDRATSGNNMYGRNWLGPPPSSFSLYDQAAAAQILVDSIELLGPTDETEDRSTSTPSVRLIVGATVGSVAALSLLTFAVLCTVRIRRRRKEAAPSTAFDIVPFATNKNGQRSPDLHKGGGSGHLTYQTHSPGGSADPAAVEPLRFPRASSVDADHSSGEGRAPNVPSYSVANVPDNRHRANEIADTGEMEMAPNFPEMVRAVYQRLWQHDGSENPPDYRSNAGDTQQ